MSRVPDMSNWEEDMGQTKNTLEELYIPFGLGVSQNPPGGARECGQGEEHLGYTDWHNNDGWVDDFKPVDGLLCIVLNYEMILKLCLKYVEML